MKKSLAIIACRATLAVMLMSLVVTGRLSAAPPETPVFKVRLDSGHPWRPPFGLERVGRPMLAVVEAAERPPAAVYTLAALRGGKEIGRKSLVFSKAQPFVARASFDGFADEFVLSAAKDAKSPSAELVRQPVQPAEFEAEALARPRDIVNPVDLGTIFVPHGWLLVGPRQSALVDVAALSRKKDHPNARLRIWFNSKPGEVTADPFGLRTGVRAERRLEIPAPPTDHDRDVLHVVLDDGFGGELWQKRIPVMVVADPPAWPKFGAAYTKLRYDPPISVRDPATGAFSSLPYEKGWDESLEDIVVSLPNGNRFVFWRGSSYIPFWAGRYNTAACYEWAEILTRFADAVDCVEPLMDKELRYSRVKIVESTASRIHVRWTYQSTDLNYKVWGDEAVEDYYFYPDGFGTRVVTLKCDPATNYELSEFIILTPQGAYPFEVLPDNLVDALALDGRKRELRFPQPAGNATGEAPTFDGPTVYRLRLSKGEKQSAVFFTPNEPKSAPMIFGPFSDRGEVVTPCYWGSHWPLARGNATGNAIDERIHLTPTHNSVMTWAGNRPAPLRSAELVTLDTRGVSRPMAIRTWAWLIGMTEDDDARLIERAQSFATPPALEIRGGRVGFEAYVPERRALLVDVKAAELTIAIRPGPPCVDPVFELTGAAKGPIRVTLAGEALETSRYAWDGATLWLDATVKEPTELRVVFSMP
jgi:hypothetical protein